MHATEYWLDSSVVKTTNWCRDDDVDRGSRKPAAQPAAWKYSRANKAKLSYYAKQIYLGSIVLYHINVNVPR
jgi:hypothetical protein